MKMKWHEITKYSPEGYHDGVYALDEWTSFYDIGKSFNGSVLTFQEYQTIEKCHIDVVSQLLSETNCRFLIIEYIEIYKDSLIHDLKKSPYNEELLKHIKLFMGMGKGRRIHINLLEPVLKFWLREYCYMILSNKSKHLKFEIGYDFYLNVCCDISTRRLREIVNSNGLYLDARG